jgi:hypothetical protein
MFFSSKKKIDKRIESPLGAATAVRPRQIVSEAYFQLKNRIHSRLLDIIDLTLIDSLDHEALKARSKRWSVGYWKKTAQPFRLILRKERNSLPISKTR